MASWNGPHTNLAPDTKLHWSPLARGENETFVIFAGNRTQGLRKLANVPQDWGNFFYGFAFYAPYPKRHDLFMAHGARGVPRYEFT